MADSMSVRAAMLRELEGEESATLRTLERLPQARWDWAPHAKSTPMGRLGVHVATLPEVAIAILTTSEFDMTARRQGAGATPQAAGDLAPTAQGLYHRVRELLTQAPDEALDASWTFRFGERVLFQGPKALALRQFFLSHTIHHRAQLGVYLRLCDLPVPAIYGPSADENNFA